MYIGNRFGLERTIVPRAGVPACFFPMSPARTPRGVAFMALAAVRALAAMLRRRPGAVLATGGYVSVPVALAAKAARIPLILFLPDTVPGKAVAWLAPLAHSVAAVSDDAAIHLPPHKTVVTGYPVRDIFLSANRSAGRRRFGIPDGDHMLLVFGGSLGARSLNRALAGTLPSLLPLCRVVHVCGEERLPEAEAAAAALAPQERERYTLVPYLHDQEMADAMAAADLVVCRSGASVIGELPLAGVPAVLVPLPEVKVHQRENAEYLVSRGAAVMLDDAALGRDLEPTIAGLLDDPQRLADMASAMRGLARPDAAGAIARLVLTAASRPGDRPTTRPQEGAGT